jgi:hypothetical protein
MIRRRGTAASHRTGQADSPPKSTPIAAVGSRSRMITSTKSAGAAFGGREPTMREIRDRAYYIYLARGGVNGDPISDWIRAERELREELGSAGSFNRRF